MNSTGKYLLKRSIFQLLGASFDVTDEAGNTVLFADQKAFKLREELKIYSSKDKSEQLYGVKARNIIDFSAIYDIVDSKSGEKLGALQRQGLKSIAQDEWHILDANDQQIGVLKEDSLLMALIRRMITNLIPQNYDLTMDSIRVADYKQNFNPFVYKLGIDLSENVNNKLDVRVALIAGIMLGAIEGKQS